MILLGSSEEVLKTLPDNSVDSIVTDPPYGLSFMGKKWDYDVPSTNLWTECLRVLKPGGYLLAFAGTRTQHRMAVRIEDAGFEIRDMIAWVYGSGFPKSLNIGKAVDKLQGNEREVFERTDGAGNKQDYLTSDRTKSEAGVFGGDKQIFLDSKGNSPYEGWGTALKPALEPITVARKPISEKNIAENVLKWGTGGINIDGTRVKTDDNLNKRYESSFQEGNSQFVSETATKSGKRMEIKAPDATAQGRFPANLIHDGSDEVVGLFPDTKGGVAINRNRGKRIPSTVNYANHNGIDIGFGDSGSAARFFYCAKASKSERNKGLEGFEVVEVRGGGGRVADGYDETTQHLKEAARKYGAVKTAKQNIHPTVKPVALMRYLVKMVTPVGGTVLDPFNGSGTTGIACKVENFEYIGIEREEEYVKISEARIAAWESEKETPQLGMF